MACQIVTQPVAMGEMLVLQLFEGGQKPLRFRGVVLALHQLSR